MIFVALFMAPGTLRDITLLAAAVLAGAAYDRRHQSAGVATGAASEATSYAGGDAGSEATGKVILVVSDGLRWQEVFRGADSLLLFSEPRFKWVAAASARKLDGDSGARRSPSGDRRR